MNTIILLVFVAGYAGITLEHHIRINKAAIALITGVLCWTLFMFSGADNHLVLHSLEGHLSEISGILFFLLGAMVIVELIDAHDGFEVITTRIKTRNKRQLLWIMGLITFFLSAVLDNLTTTIVMVSLLRKIISEREDRLFFAGIIVITANAGGAWSPIGDVTTTMLWIGGQVSAQNIVISLIIPSLACLAAPLVYLHFKFKGNIERVIEEKAVKAGLSEWERNTVFILGVVSLLFVPVFKTYTHLPPFMGMMLMLGLMWVVTELIHAGKDDSEKGILSINHALRKIDTPSILFFLGILLAVSALSGVGILTSAAAWLDQTLQNQSLIVILIGLLSAVVDNVPLVAAAQGMYPLSSFPMDHYLWEFLAYTTGTGGSILIIGSAAGVAAMGMEKIDFFWYLKRISILALLGYFAGAAVYILQYQLMH
jgi:Na+/H+ antiporter NhaD/arsenite permease-like protein